MLNIGTTQVGSVRVNNARLTKLYGELTKFPENPNKNPNVDDLLMNQLLNGNVILSLTLNVGGKLLELNNFHCREYHQGINGTISKEGVLTTDDCVITSLKLNGSDQYYRFYISWIVEYKLA